MTRYITLAVQIAAIAGLTVFGYAACDDTSDRGANSSTDTDADTDTDGDTDTDTDGDTDSDSDSDSDTDTEDCYEHIDIVFVLDVSTSMGNMLQELEWDIPEVWDAANDLTELDDDTHFGLVVFVDDYAVANDGSTPYASASELEADFNYWWSHTSTNQQTQSSASNIDWPENSLDALVAGATFFQWRDEETTLRVIIHATDDTFLEHPASFSSGIQVQSDYQQTIYALQEQTIRVASFAAHLGGSTGTINVEPGFFTDYAGQSSIPAATSGSVFEIGQVGGTLSLAAAINEFVAEEFCSDYVIE